MRMEEVKKLEKSLPRYVRERCKSTDPVVRKSGVSVLGSTEAQLCSTGEISVALTNCIRRGALRLRIDRGSRARFLPGRS